MWKATIAFTLNVDEAELEHIDKRSKIGVFIDDFDCLEETCFKSQLIKLFSKSSAINVFSSIEPGHKTNEYSLKGLIYKINVFFQTPALHKKLYSVYQDAHNDLILDLLIGADKNTQKNKILTILKEEHYEELKNINEWVSGAGLNCSKNPLNCEECCWLLKEVVPNKLEAILYNSFDNYSAAKESIKSTGRNK